MEHRENHFAKCFARGGPIFPGSLVHFHERLTKAGCADAIGATRPETRAIPPPRRRRGPARHADQRPIERLQRRPAPPPPATSWSLTANPRGGGRVEATSTGRFHARLRAVHD